MVPSCRRRRRRSALVLFLFVSQERDECNGEAGAEIWRDGGAPPAAVLGQLLRELLQREVAPVRGSPAPAVLQPVRPSSASGVPPFFLCWSSVSISSFSVFRVRRIECCCVEKTKEMGEGAVRNELVVVEDKDDCNARECVDLDRSDSDL